MPASTDVCNDFLHPTQALYARKMDNMKKRSVRINRIIDTMRDENGATVKRLAQKLEVSEMTIRRDLELLRVNNVIFINHGVAYFNPNAEKTDVNSKYNIIHERGENDVEKEAIGRAAAKLIEPGDTIILDSGTTTEQVARFIPLNYQITVLCYTLNVLEEVSKKTVNSLLFGGGVFHFNSQMFESEESIHLINRTRANKVFLSAGGVSDRFGLTCANLYEVQSKVAAIDSSVERILVVDFSKFEKVELAFFSKLDCINTVVTDNKAPEEWIKLLRDMGIRVIVA